MKWAQPISSAGCSLGRRADFLQLPAKSKIHIEGVLTAELAVPGKCRIFREGWHIATS